MIETQFESLFCGWKVSSGKSILYDNEILNTQILMRKWNQGDPMIISIPFSGLRPL